MRLKLPPPRLSVRSMALLIAVVAVALWATLRNDSPIQRLSHYLRPDYPDSNYREPAMDLARAIPSWDVDEAVSMLINARSTIRTRACVTMQDMSWSSLARAEKAVPRLITALSDEDLVVRSSAARALGSVVESGSAKRTEAVTALYSHPR